MGSGTKSLVRMNSGEYLEVSMIACIQRYKSRNSILIAGP